MQGRRSEIAELASNFYRNQFRKTLNWLAATVVVMLLLIVAIVYVILTRPEQTYYANTTQGRILPMPQQG